jgi:hypothetical protein
VLGVTDASVDLLERLTQLTKLMLKVVCKGHSTQPSSHATLSSCLARHVLPALLLHSALLIAPLPVIMVLMLFASYNDNEVYMGAQAHVESPSRFMREDHYDVIFP